MRKLSFFASLFAAAALTACGGGEEAADTAESDAASDTAAMETSGEDMGGEDAGMTADEPMDEPQEAPAEPDASADDGAMTEEPAAEAGSDDAMGGDDMASGGDEGQFMVAGLTGDPEQGRRVFARCRSCHVLEEGVNRVGPSLYGIFGREAGSVEGFRYSEANQTSGITWTHETMFEYLENPREYIPGTIMAFPGLRDEQDRADVIAYISANGGEG